MMRKQLFLVLMALLPYVNYGQESKKIDSTAIFILDKMSDLIGDLESVTINITTSIDKLNDSGNIETYYSTSNVSMVGPDKLIAKTNGDNGNNGYWYDGKYLSYYSYDENNYLTLEASDNIISMIDTMHVRFDFKFPAADFFYPSFTDDILEAFDTIKFMGKKTIDGEECYQIMALNNDMNVQLWVSSETHFLPKKMMIIYKKKNNLHYTTTFNNWLLNPKIPETLFDFLPPPNAKLISILEK
jgi:hypothetical protein